MIRKDFIAMSEKNDIWVNDILENKTKREIVAFLIDTSMSMSIKKENTNKSRIDIVNERMPIFLDQMANDIFIREGLSVSVTTFGTKAKTIINFTNPSDAKNYYRKIIANDSKTNLGEGVEKALGEINEYINILQAGGIEYYHPILMIITDGDTTDPDKTRQIARKVQEDKHLKVICYNIGVLTDKSKRTLELFAKDDSFIKNINDMNLSDVFTNLSRELTVASQRQIEVDFKKLVLQN